MGCDIHMHVERYGYAGWDEEKKHEGWQPVPWRLIDCYVCNGTGVLGVNAFGTPAPIQNVGKTCKSCVREFDVYDVYDMRTHGACPPGKVREPWLANRNYNRFAMLANVRNGAGFAGIKTGDGFEYIAEPRGLPEDVYYGIQEMSDEYGIDGHSHSWCMVDELLAFLNKPRESSMLCGYVTPKEYVEWKTEGSPSSWCGDTSGPKGSKLQMETLIDSGVLDLSEEDMWNARLYTFVEWPVTYKDAFGKDGIEQLHALQDLYPGPLRLVFWFDS